MTLHETLVALRDAALLWKKFEHARLDAWTFRPYAGICFHVQMVAGVDARDQLQDLMEKWPNRHPECVAYPVDGYEEYDAGCRLGRAQLWDNPRRWELLDWLIKETTPRPLTLNAGEMK